MELSPEFKKRKVKKLKVHDSEPKFCDLAINHRAPGSKKMDLVVLLTLLCLDDGATPFDYDSGSIVGKKIALEL